VKRIKTRIAPQWDTIELIVPVHFSDVDSMKLVWHGHYLRYCEDAREAYCAARGLSYKTMEDEGCVAPVARLQIEYLAPARMGYHLQVRCGRQPGTEPYLNLVYEIRGPVPAPAPAMAAAASIRASPSPADLAAPRLLCICETIQVFIDLSGQPYLSAPPPVERFFAAIAACERARAGAR